MFTLNEGTCTEDEQLRIHVRFRSLRINPNHLRAKTFEVGLGVYIRVIPINFRSLHLNRDYKVPNVPIIQISRSEEFHFGGSSGGEMQPFMQFSVATHKLCTFNRAQLTCSIQCDGI